MTTPSVTQTRTTDATGHAAVDASEAGQARFDELIAADQRIELRDMGAHPSRGL